MSSVERNILTIIDPTIVLDQLSIPDVESGTDNAIDHGSMKEKLSKFSVMIPIIRINEYEVQGDRLEFFELDNTGFYPTCRFSFFDRDGLFTARNFPKDGDLIQVYIRSQGDESTFKPIRIDFTVEDIRPLGGGGSTANSGKFLVEGRINIPNLFTEKVEYQEGTSFDALLNIAEGLKLGYASNIEDTVDEQIWTNPYDTSQKFIQDISANTYLNDDSFFTSYIDPYYYLTLVEVNRLFDQEDDLETVLIYAQNSADTMGAGDEEDSQYVGPLFLSNMTQLQGTSIYISTYQQINQSGLISKNHGYKRYAQYWDIENKSFISEYVDPLTDDTPGMISVTKGRVIDGKPEGPRNDQVKYKYLGTQGDNMHDNYMYSAILNYQNLVEINKFGMIIELDTMNPTITRYSRIYCQIFEFAPNVKTVLTAPDNKDDVPTDVQRRQEREDDFGNDPSSQNGILNEYLSGFYVVTGIEYILTKPGPMRMKLHLRRREVIPTT